MASTHINIPFRVVDDIFEPVTPEDDNTLLWVATCAVDAKSTPFEVTLARTKLRVNEATPADYAAFDTYTNRGNLKTAYERSQDAFGGHDGYNGSVLEEVEVDGRKGKGYQVAVSGLIVMVRRMQALTAPFDEIERMVKADCRVTIRYNGQYDFRINTTLSTGLEDPARFDTADLRQMERLAAAVVVEPGHCTPIYATAANRQSV